MILCAGCPNGIEQKAPPSVRSRAKAETRPEKIKREFYFSVFDLKLLIWKNEIKRARTVLDALSYETKIESLRKIMSNRKY